MMKKKKLLLTVISLLMGIAPMALAVEVISVDINNFTNDTVYAGEAAVPGATQWVAYYGDWGIPLGSPRSADLADTVTVQPSTYAEQVWLGDPGDHGYISGVGDGLLDDGFFNDGSGTSDPSVVFVGNIAGAYGGTFDVCVYGNSEGTFTLKEGDAVIETATITGTTTGFVEGENYALFQDISLADPNSITLVYSNELNGIQLVSTKATPVPIIASADPNTNVIDARDYDVAHDTNNRSGEQTLYGPDIGSVVFYLDEGEYMEYDIAVDAANQGLYEITANVGTEWGPANLSLYLDGVLHGTLTFPQTGDKTINATNAATVNLFEGNHTLKWAAETSQIYFNVVELKIVYLGDISLTDCAELSGYPDQVLIGDINNDCRVGLDDLLLLTSEWTENYINQ
ncbi:MAG: carbohydrate-binding protein [Planctomycetes bacterium]|nr:carbohydrate-binding protein [Planctomycetota bacterium]